jgi:steroid 5-alpha reductase family enzyme
VAAAAVIPLTLYKTSYAISVGYGAAVFLIGLSAQLAFPSSPLVGRALIGSLMFYGLRLSSYLFLREKTRKTPPAQGMKESPIPKRLTLALSVSLFYAFLTTPALYVLRNLDVILNNPKFLLITQSGLGLAVCGAILEAVADLQKYTVKQKQNGDEKTFEGPTEWSYRVVRHPNYLGEVIYWTGIFVCGTPAFGTNIIPWVSSVLGLFGTFSIACKKPVLCSIFPIIFWCSTMFYSILVSHARFFAWFQELCPLCERQPKDWKSVSKKNMATKKNIKSGLPR